MQNSGQQDWQRRGYIQEYSKAASDPAANRYEYEINLPALLDLIPSDARRLLDYGCSTGYLTSLLGRKYERVDGCDISEYSIKAAGNLHPGSNYFIWDGREPLAGSEGFYDVVFAKLVLPAVENLHPLAANFHSILRDRGCIVASVPHPLSAVVRFKDVKYFENTRYAFSAGDLRIELIHRSLSDYILPFSQNGFVLDALNEPELSSPSLQQEYVSQGRDPNLPSRLNMRFAKL